MALQGSQKLAVLLCRFSDNVETEPHPASFHEDLFVNRGTGGLNDDWIAASLGAIHLDGSQVFGWKTFDITRAEFLEAHAGRWNAITKGWDLHPRLDKINAAIARASSGTDPRCRCSKARSACCSSRCARSGGSATQLRCTGAPQSARRFPMQPDAGRSRVFFDSPVQSLECDS